MEAEAINNQNMCDYIDAAPNDMQHGESRTNKPPYQTIKTNYKLLRSKMRWFSNSSTWDDPNDVTRFYNRINGNYDLLIYDKTIDQGDVYG